MPLILAIEPDRRQAAQLATVVRRRVHAELILVDTTERALDAIGNRMPDLVLVPALLSPQDDAALAAALRVIAAAARVQLLTIPVLGSARPTAPAGGMLSALRRGKSKAGETEGCDPVVFAEQIASYLESAAQERVHAGLDVHEDPQPESLAEATAGAAATAESESQSDAMLAEFASEFADPEYDEAAVAVSEEHVENVGYVESVVEAVESAEGVEGVASEAGVEGVENTNNGNNGDNGESPRNGHNDESVSFALEEAVRALFATPATVDVPAETLVSPTEVMSSEDDHEDVMAAETETVEAVEPDGQDEWTEVERLMAGLQMMPLSAIEATDEAEWIAPVIDNPKHIIQQTPRVADEPAAEAISVTNEVKSAEHEADAAQLAAGSGREWVALIESLRSDVERLRAERSEKPGKMPGTAPRAARADRKAKPAQDEWGFFDPEQCGFAALLAKLDEVTEADDSRTND